MFTCYLMPLLQIDTDASRDRICTSMEEITHALVDLKEHFDELDSAITYQVRPPGITPFETKLSYTKVPSEHTDHFERSAGYLRELVREKTSV
jgi:hypothetical protein